VIVARQPPLFFPPFSPPCTLSPHFPRKCKRKLRSVEENGERMIFPFFLFLFFRAHRYAGQIELFFPPPLSPSSLNGRDLFIGSLQLQPHSKAYTVQRGSLPFFFLFFLPSPSSGALIAANSLQEILAMKYPDSYRLRKWSPLFFFFFFFPPPLFSRPTCAWYWFAVATAVLANGETIECTRKLTSSFFFFFPPPPPSHF